MKYNGNQIRPVKYIVLIVFTVILVSAFILIHGIYERGLKADIFMHQREIERKIWKTVYEEYNRFYIISETGRALVSEGGGNVMEGRIPGLSGLFGPDGQFPDIVTGAGYFDAERPEIQFFYDFDSEKWSRTDFPVDADALERNWFAVDDNKEHGDTRIFLLVKPHAGTQGLLFEISRERFNKTYIEPAVAAAADEYLIHWDSFVPEYNYRNRENQTGFNPDKYRFQPLLAIMGISKDKTPLIIPVPGFPDYRKDSGHNTSELSEDNGPGGKMPFVINPEFFLSLRHQKGSFYYELERKAAANYLESVLLLSVIAISFLFLFFQFEKLRQMRQKEKEFVASITHELRTPLTVIQAAADNLSTGIVPPDKLKVYGSLIIEQSARLGKMIEEILLFSNMEDKKHNCTEPVLIDFRSLIPDLKATLDAIASSSGINLIWETGSLPAQCRGDLQTVMLVTENLVSNAVFHAYGNGGGSVRISMRFQISGALNVIVEDDGRGIEPREARRVFEPFYRDSICRERQEKGSGLGLFIARRKAELAGGSLKLESPYERIDGRKTEGCRFTLSLPCRSETEAVDG